MAVRAKGSLYLRRKKDSKQPTQASGSSTSAAQRENAPQKNFAYQDGQPRQNAAATLTRPPRSFTSRLPVPIGTAKYTVEIQRPGKVGLESSVRKSHHKTRASPEQKRHSPRRRTEVSMRDYTDNFTTTSSSSPPSSSASSSWPREICTRSASPESPRRHTNRKVVPKPPHFGLEGHDQRTSQHDRDIAALKAKYLSAMKEREALSALENRVEHILKARWKREAGDVFEDAWNINSSRDPRDDRRQASDRPRESKAEDVTDTETFLSSLRKRYGLDTDSPAPSQPSVDPPSKLQLFEAAEHARSPTPDEDGTECFLKTLRQRYGIPEGDSSEPKVEQAGTRETHFLESHSSDPMGYYRPSSTDNHLSFSVLHDPMSTKSESQCEQFPIHVVPQHHPHDQLPNVADEPMTSRELEGTPAMELRNDTVGSSRHSKPGALAPAQRSMASASLHVDDPAETESDIDQRIQQRLDELTSRVQALEQQFQSFTSTMLLNL